MFTANVRSALLALAASAIAVNAAQSVSLKVTGMPCLDTFSINLTINKVLNL
jgi:hypothetical protein